MTILDAYALIAALADEPARDDVEPHLRRRDARIATPNLVEVYDRCIRLRGLERNEVDSSINALVGDRALTIVSLDDRAARRAGELRALHYHRTRRPLSLADCVVVAVAELSNDAVATPDDALAWLARRLGVELIALPGSSGRRPRA